MGRFSRQFSRRWWSRGKNKSSDDVVLSAERLEGGDRRQLLQALSAMVGGSALAAMTQPAEAKDASELPAPKRALTGRNEAGKSVFKSFGGKHYVIGGLVLAPRPPAPGKLPREPAHPYPPLSRAISRYNQGMIDARPANVTRTGILASLLPASPSAEVMA